MKIYNNVIVSVIASTMLSTGVAQAYDGAKKQCGDHPRNGMMQAVKKLDLTKEQGNKGKIKHTKATAPKNESSPVSCSILDGEGQIHGKSVSSPSNCLILKKS